MVLIFSICCFISFILLIPSSLPIPTRLSKFVGCKLIFNSSDIPGIFTSTKSPARVCFTVAPGISNSFTHCSNSSSVTSTSSSAVISTNSFFTGAGVSTSGVTVEVFSPLDTISSPSTVVPADDGSSFMSSPLSSS